MLYGVPESRMGTSSLPKFVAPQGLLLRTGLTGLTKGELLSSWRAPAFRVLHVQSFSLSGASAGHSENDSHLHAGLMNPRSTNHEFEREYEASHGLRPFSWSRLSRQFLPEASRFGSPYPSIYAKRT